MEPQLTERGLKLTTTQEAQKDQDHLVVVAYLSFILWREVKCFWKSQGKETSMCLYGGLMWSNQPAGSAYG